MIINDLSLENFCMSPPIHSGASACPIFHSLPLNLEKSASSLLRGRKMSRLVVKEEGREKKVMGLIPSINKILTINIYLSKKKEAYFEFVALHSEFTSTLILGRTLNCVICLCELYYSFIQ